MDGIAHNDLLRFFRKQGLVYLRRPRYEGDVLQGYSWDRDPYYRKNQSEFSMLRDRYGACLDQDSRPELKIQRIDRSVGWGLYTSCPIKAGAFIGEYTGVVRPIRNRSGHVLEYGGFSTDYAWGYPAGLSEDFQYEMDALKEGNELRFANHSFEPNCAVDHFPWENRWVIFFRSLRDMGEGDQILIDYGEDYWAAPGREMVLL